MTKLWSLMLATILLITCSGCFWGWERDRQGHDSRDGYRHDNPGDRDGHRHNDPRDPYDRR